MSRKSHETRNKSTKVRLIGGFRMMMRIGMLCKLCNTIFKDNKQALQHFIIEHTDVAKVKLEEFLVPDQYMDTEDDINQEDSD